MEDSELFSAAQRLPTSRRPLLGLTILVVEDSRFACEAMRLLCLRSGARIRRADCVKSARRHLKAYRPSVAIVDIGLPDGSGLDLIREISSATPRVSVLLGTSGDLGREDEARDAGANGFLQKPVSALATFQQSIIDHLPEEWRLAGPRSLSDEIIEPDVLAFQDDMAHAADILADAECSANLDYLAQFLGGVARSIGDTPLADAADRLASARKSGDITDSAQTLIAGLVQDRLENKVAI
ncbi:Response regulator receiver domain-containing protein [Epibacterium ulvae]|uniref:Response regulator receiver domain-containing protein n=1 Tax=Epibacterium ulvae TaxID=1156985 RepID=A0A1G5PVF1_9RHOB|nr:response regulator [Epibacterium ulvae]SCZ53029.1 Response regulator receiver domain-containing protein [Epibacterium ulvae]